MAEDSLRLSYRPLSDASPEAEVEALAAVYRFILDRHENRMAVGTGDRSDKEGGEKG